MDKSSVWGAAVLAVGLCIAQSSIAETPAAAQAAMQAQSAKMQMDTAKANIKNEHMQGLRMHLEQNQAEQKQLQAALQQKQAEQRQLQAVPDQASVKDQLLQNQREQRQLATTLEQKQKMQLQMMSDLEKVKAAQ